MRANIAIVFLGLGQRDPVLDWLEKAYQDRDVHLLSLGVEPKWDALRSHPPFQSLIRRIDLPM
jgi:hypothetical protein